jgi:orotate phosphoribosyltransferase
MIMQVLIDFVQNNAIIYAEKGNSFILATGARSRYYIDFDKVMLTVKGSHLVGVCLLRKLIDLDFDLIGGPSSGADSIITAYLTMTNQDVEGFRVRKKAKEHGANAGEMIDGEINEGDRAVIVEDVTTSGNSVMKAIDEVEKRGGKVIKVITMLDRLAGAKELLKNYDFESIMTINDLIIKKE